MEEKHKKKVSNPQRNSHSDEYPELSDYNLIKVLGSGSFGKVFKAIHKTKNTVCAIKIIEKNNVKNHDIYRLLSETQILSSLNHQNIVMFHNAQETKEHLFIFTECVSNGSLSDLMEMRITSNNHFSDLEASQIIKSLLHAVKYIHQKDIVHRDLKPANILIENDKDLSSVKVTDFGLSAMISEYSSKFFTEQCGTPMYMAPELIENKVYSKPVDIWSCGIIMYWLLNHGVHPIQAKTKDELIKGIIKCEWNFPEDSFTDLAKDFFLKLTCKQPEARYIAEQALKHPWITRDVHGNIPLTFEEKYHLFLKETEILNLLKAVFFTGYVLRLQQQQRSSNHLAMPANQNKKYKIVTRPKSLTTGSKDNINETTTKNINPAEITLRKCETPDIKIQQTFSPDKNHIRIRSIPSKELQASIDRYDPKNKTTSIHTVVKPKVFVANNSNNSNLKSLENAGRPVVSKFGEVENGGKFLTIPGKTGQLEQKSANTSRSNIGLDNSFTSNRDKTVERTEANEKSPCDKIHERPKTNERLSEKTNERPSEKTNERLSEKINEKLGEKSNEKQSDKNKERLNTKTNEKFGKDQLYVERIDKDPKYQTTSNFKSAGKVNKSVSLRKEIEECKNIDKALKSNTSESPLKEMKKSQTRLKDPMNLTTKSMLFRDSSSSSPLKQKTFMKSPRDLNDIEIDKESLMQLNRATNQFFSKKVKETIQNSMLFQKPGSSEKKNNPNNSSSLDETTFSIRSLDNNNKSTFFKERDTGLEGLKNKKAGSPVKMIDNILGETHMFPMINSNRGLKTMNKPAHK